MKREAYERKVKPRVQEDRYMLAELKVGEPISAIDMGLAPGGRMRQEIYDDPYELQDWDTRHGSRCFIHLANAFVWRAITKERPPTVPPTAKEYSDAALPWFEYYAADVKALEGSETLAGLKSVAKMGDEKGDVPLPENESVDPERIVKLREAMAENQVREGAF